jgi:hypothetical protein
MSIPSGLIEQLKTGNVVLFCGAGISTSEGGIPGARQLAQKLAQRAELRDVGGMSLPEVAQVYETKMGHQSLIAFIAEQIEGAGQSPLSTHRLIASLPFKIIITTNWDALLEEALRLAGKRIAKVVRDSDVAFFDESKVTVIKLHGSVDQKDTIVITGDDYYEVFARLPETANLVRSYFATKTLLFLGYGLADEDFKRMFREVEQHLGRHMRRAYAVQLDPRQNSIDYWRQKNVEVIAADATEFLEDLSRALGSAPSEQTPQRRRIDAAAPGAVAIGKPFDLLVQIRFPHSPRLGAEQKDWPTGETPPSLSQTSSERSFEFPKDLQTGQLKSAALEIQVVAPDFTIEGSATERLKVPPDAYSQVVQFLLTPNRFGKCRINVKVLDVDRALVGTIPLETTVGEAIAPVQLVMANLFLVVVVFEMGSKNVHLEPRPELLSNSRRQHLQTKLDELQRRYDTLSSRIAALDTDIGRASTSLERQVLDEQRSEMAGERDRIADEMQKIEEELARLGQRETEEQEQPAALYGQEAQYLQHEEWSDTSASFQQTVEIGPDYEDALYHMSMAKENKHRSRILKQTLLFALLVSLTVAAIAFIILWRSSLTPTTPSATSIPAPSNPATSETVGPSTPVSTPADVFAPAPDCRVVALSLETMTRTLTATVTSTETPVLINLSSEDLANEQGRLSVLVGSADVTVDGSPTGTMFESVCKCRWHAHIDSAAATQSLDYWQPIGAADETCDFSLPLPLVASSVEFSLTVGTNPSAYSFFVMLHP